MCFWNSAISSFSRGMVVGPVAQGQRQAERREAVAAAPGGLAQRRMPIEAVAPQAELAHRGEVRGGGVEVLPLAGQLAGRRQDRPGHEDRVAHLVVIRHDRQRLAVLAEDLVRRGAAQQRSSARGPSPSPATPAPRRSGGPPARCRTSERAISRRAGTARRSCRLPPRTSASPVNSLSRNLATSGKRRDVRDLVELVAIDGGELLGHLPRRTREAIRFRFHRSREWWVLGGGPSRQRGGQADAEQPRVPDLHGFAARDTDTMLAAARAERVVRRWSRHGRFFSTTVLTRHQYVFQIDLSNR